MEEVAESDDGRKPSRPNRKGTVAREPDADDSPKHDRGQYGEQRRNGYAVASWRVRRTMIKFRSQS